MSGRRFGPTARSTCLREGACPGSFPEEVGRVGKEEMAVRRGNGILGLLLGLALLLGGASAGSSLEKGTMALGWIPIGGDTGYFVAADQGFYKDVGAEVTIVRGFGAADSAKKVAQGAVEFGNGDTSALIAGRAKEGWKTKAVAMILQKSMLAWYVLKGSGITKPKDIEGKKLGEPPGGANRQMFPALAAANGIDLNKVTFVNMEPAATVPSLLAGRVDAIGMYTGSSPALHIAARKEGKEAVGIVYADWGVNVYGNSINVQDAFIAKKPDLVRGVTQASMKGMKWALDNPQKAMDVFLKFNPTASREVVFEQWKIYMEHFITPEVRQNGLGYMDKGRMTYSRDIVTKYLALPVSVPVEDLYTNEFLSKVLP